MTKTVFGIFMFVAGATVGVAATYKFFKDKYDKKSREDIEEIREYYASKKAKEDDSSEESLGEILPLCESDDADLTEAHKEQLEKYKKLLIDNCGYAPRDDEAKPVTNTECKQPVKFSDENNTIPIKPDDFGEIVDEETGETYDKMTLVYYEDGVVTYWEDGHTVDDVEDLLGTEFKDHFGDYGEEDAVYVRNIRNETDYEVIRDGDKYYDFHTEERGGEDE